MKFIASLAITALLTNSAEATSVDQLVSSNLHSFLMKDAAKVCCPCRSTVSYSCSNCGCPSSETSGIPKKIIKA